MSETDQPEQEMMMLMRRTPWYAAIGGAVGGLIGALLACLLHCMDKM
jgi:hypothetical protein